MIFTVGQIKCLSEAVGISLKSPLAQPIIVLNVYVEYHVESVFYQSVAMRGIPKMLPTRWNRISDSHKYLCEFTQTFRFKMYLCEFTQLHAFHTCTCVNSLK